MSQAWLSDARSDGGLGVMVAVSAVLHVAAAGIVFLLPGHMFVPTPPPVVAYTVKIVDPSALGGRLTKGEIKPEAPPEPEPQPARVEPEPAKPEPKPAEPEPEAKAPEPEPPKPPEPKEEKPPEPEKAVVLPEKKPEPPKPKPAEKKPPEKKPPDKKPAAKPESKAKPTKEELARAERDKQIQEAIARLGEKGKGKEASGLGGREEGKGAALGMGGDGGGGGVLTGLDFIIYKNKVEGIIKKNWTWVGSNPNLTIRVGFRIQENGDIGDLRIVARSGDSSFDESVVRAIRVSSPLPPPPEKYRATFADYVLEFVSGDLAAG